MCSDTIFPGWPSQAPTARRERRGLEVRWESMAGETVLRMPGGRWWGSRPGRGVGTCSEASTVGGGTGSWLGDQVRSGGSFEVAGLEHIGQGPHCRNPFSPTAPFRSCSFCAPKENHAAFFMDNPKKKSFLLEMAMVPRILGSARAPFITSETMEPHSRACAGQQERGPEAGRWKDRGES